MSTRSTELFFRLHESADKFDYFVCGVAGALFAYIGQNYHPKKLELGIPLCEPISLLFLAGAFFVGLKHIEKGILNKHTNCRMLDAAEKAGNLTAALNKGAGPFYNQDSGDIFSRQEAETSRNEYLNTRKSFEAKLQANRVPMRRLYRIRNALLLLGFVAIFLSKLLQPYAIP